MTKNNYMFGNPDITFIWHGEWGDPEIEYRDHRFNYWDVLDSICDIAKEDNGIPYDEDISDDKFDEWIANNTEWIQDYMDDLVFLTDSAQ